MDEKEAEFGRKIKKAAQLLFFQRHLTPGVKGWELKKALGRDYLEVIALLNSELDKLDLEVKMVEEEAGKAESARYFIRLKRGEAEASSGIRIDDLAALAATLAFMVSRQGKVPRKEVETLLREKFLKWRVEMNLDRFIRRGYLEQDEEDILYIGWRTRAEIDQKALVGLILGG